MQRSFSVLIVAASLSQLAACSKPAQGETSEAVVARGQQLVQIGGCNDCHSPVQFDQKLGMPVPVKGRMLSGHPEGAPEPKNAPGAGDQAVISATFTSFRLPFGTVYAANLTPDRETGLGAWTADEFVKTMRTGHRRGNGRAVLPPMPWQNLSRQPEDDLKAIFAYLQSVPPVRNRVPQPAVPPAVVQGISASYAVASKNQH